MPYYIHASLREEAVSEYMCTIQLGDYPIFNIYCIRIGNLNLCTM
jgi:hypothetical protein